MANTYATWDPATKGTLCTLSNGNLTATSGTGTGVTATSALSTISKTSGKWYWEITITTIQTPNYDTMTGVCDSSFNVNTGNAFGDVHAWSIGRDGGSSYLNDGAVGLFSNTSNLLVAGDIIGIAWDAGGQTEQFYLNNTLYTVHSGTATTGPATGFAMCNLFFNNAVTANFGATALAFTPPSGYNAGLYTPGASANSGFFMAAAR